MVVVYDLREPLPVCHPIHILRLGLGRHVKIPIVVVAYILLIEARDARGRPLFRNGVAHVPVRHQLHAVRIGVHGEENDIIEKPHSLLVSPADHLVHPLHELMRAQNLRRVQSAVDPNHRLPFPRQRPSLFLGDAFGQCEPSGDVLVASEIGEVLWGRNDRHELRAPFGGATDFLQHHPGRLLRKLSPILCELRVGRQVIVISDVEAELLPGSRDSLGLDRRRYE